LSALISDLERVRESPNRVLGDPFVSEFVVVARQINPDSSVLLDDRVARRERYSWVILTAVPFVVFVLLNLNSTIMWARSESQKRIRVSDNINRN
jgi:hypothetical protein